MPTILSLLISSLLQSTTAPPLSIELVFIGAPLNARVEAVALGEAQSIWAPHHVALRVVPTDHFRQESVMRLVVVVTDHRDQHLKTGAVGAVRFRAGAPEPTILLFSETIEMLLDEAPALHHGTECPPAVREQMTGRLIGRALAHEIGHVLLRSRDHSRDGLMRATHRSSDLIAPERQGFGLSVDDGKRVDEIVAALSDHMTRGVATTLTPC